MSDQNLWLIPFCPFLGALVILLLGKPVLRGQSHWPCIIGAVAACVLSFMTLMSVRGMEHEAMLQDSYAWFQAGDLNVHFSMRADGLACVMLMTVTFVGSLIAIFSAGYMHGDPGYPRFFAEVSLFLAAMTTLVLANDFILLYAGWEGVGVCSYLLIGFWFAKPAAAAAARKAFLVTRLGDIGLFLGILLLWSYTGSLEYQDVFARAQSMPPWMLTIGVSPALRRRRRQVGPVPASRLVARRDGRPLPRLRPHPRGDDGHRRRLPRRPPHAAERPCPPPPDRGRVDRRFHVSARRPDRADADRPQTRSRLLDRQPARLHVPRARLGHFEAATSSRSSRSRRRSSTCSRTPSSKPSSSSRPAR